MGRDMKLDKEKRAHLHSHLDRERTYLANERTMLSYVRTCFALVFAGFGIIRFFDVTRANSSIAYFMILVGLIVGTIGIWLFAKRKRAYNKIPT